jgi:hypothetical protein
LRMYLSQRCDCQGEKNPKRGPCFHNKSIDPSVRIHKRLSFRPSVMVDSVCRCYS